jgi:hypothetical protein
MGFGLEIEIEVWLGPPMTNNLNIAGNFAGFCSKPATATGCHRLQILRVVHGFLHSLHERSELESEQTPSAVTISHQQGSTPCWRTSTDIKSRELQGLPPKTCHLQVEENSPHKQCLWLVASAFTPGASCKPLIKLRRSLTTTSSGHTGIAVVTGSDSAHFELNGYNIDWMWLDYLHLGFLPDE